MIQFFVKGFPLKIVKQLCKAVQGCKTTFANISWNEEEGGIIDLFFKAKVINVIDAFLRTHYDLPQRIFPLNTTWSTTIFKVKINMNSHHFKII